MTDAAPHVGALVEVYDLLRRAALRGDPPGGVPRIEDAPLAANKEGAGVERARSNEPESNVQQSSSLQAAA